MNPIVARVSKNISAARKMAKLKQSELADLLGVSAQSVSEWERGNMEPSSSKLQKMGELFGLNEAGLWFYYDHSKEPAAVAAVAKSNVIEMRPRLSLSRMEDVLLRMAEKTGMDVGAILGGSDVGALLTAGQVAPDFSKISSQAGRSHQASRRQRQPKAS